MFKSFIFPTKNRITIVKWMVAVLKIQCCRLSVGAFSMGIVLNAGCTATVRMHNESKYAVLLSC